jgi:hypothetical protein
MEPALEPCSGMENGCEWRFHPSTMMSVAVYVLSSFFFYCFRPVLGYDIALEPDWTMNYIVPSRSMYLFGNDFGRGQSMDG